MRTLLILIAIASVWLGGSVLADMVGERQAEFDRDTAAIAAGHAVEHIYRVAEKRTRKEIDPVLTRQRTTDGSGNVYVTKYVLVLEGPRRLLRELPHDVWQTVRVGQDFKAFHLDKRIRVPAFDGGEGYSNSQQAIWIFCWFATLVLTGGIIFLHRRTIVRFTRGMLIWMTMGPARSR